MRQKEAGVGFRHITVGPDPVHFVTCSKMYRPLPSYVFSLPVCRSEWNSGFHGLYFYRRRGICSSKKWGAAHVRRLGQCAQRVAARARNPITSQNATAPKAIRKTGTPPQRASSGIAMPVHNPPPMNGSCTSCLQAKASAAGDS